MIKWYYCNISTYHNNTFIGSYNRNICTDNDVFNRDINLTWETVEEFYQSNGLDCKFNIWHLNKGKGRRISFFHDKIFSKKDYRDIKEWKVKDLNITISYTYHEYTPTLDEVLKYPDYKKSIRWLRENSNL